VQDRRRLRLRSVVFDTIWPADEALSAGCNRVWSRIRSKLPRRSEVVHDVPVWRCSCGIYAAHDPDLAAEYLYLYSDVHQPRVVYRAIGQVAMWGSVVESESGWRAAHAYPKRLFLPRSHRRRDVDAICNGLADYRVPIDILDDGESPVARAVRHVRRDRRRRRAVASSG
jgi:hypothetical protein